MGVVRQDLGALTTAQIRKRDDTSEMISDAKKQMCRRMGRNISVVSNLDELGC